MFQTSINYNTGNTDNGQPFAQVLSQVLDTTVIAPDAETSFDSLYWQFEGGLGVHYTDVNAIVFKNGELDSKAA